MSLSTYADLKSTVATFLNRSNLTAYIPYFIQLCERKIAYGDRTASMIEPLRIRSMETSADIAVVAGTKTSALPTGYLQSRRLYLNSDPIQELEYIVPDVFWRTYISSTTGKPTRFTVEGENFVFGPIPDASYTGKCLYYKKFDALSADADTNWLLTNAFDVYLNGALAEAFKYIRNNDEAIAHFTMFAGGINALNLADKGDRYSGSPWMAVSDTGNP